ncbi:MAG: SDR family NAD(P)-dependent oxidoreductase [Hyphomicrobiaceae bacterium]
MTAGCFDGRTVLITGAGNGIGRGIASAFAKQGAHVWLTDIDREAAEAASTELGKTGGKTTPYALDVTNPQNITALLSAIESDSGRIDTLINNAGLNVRADFRHMTDDDWQTIRETNLDSVVRISRDAFSLLKASDHASIVNLASIMAGRGLRQLVGYTATKGAVVSLTRGLAVEYAAFDIRVNALAPGFVETALTDRILRNPHFNKALIDQTPLRRFGTADDIANAAVFLASDQAAFITGETLTVDGGMSIGL